MPTARFARRATTRRALKLLNDFRFEQTDPARFYGAIAADSVDLIEDFFLDHTNENLTNKVVLDVGGGPGYFADHFAARGAHYLSVEPDPTEMHAAGLTQQASVRGSGLALPFQTASVDVCYSSNVAEHVAEPWVMANEMLRVTRPGGLLILSYTLWFGPFGGHEMGLTHYFGGARAARWYTKKHGHPPKNLYGTSLFPITASQGINWSKTIAPHKVIAQFPRYLPAWLWPIMRIPLLREVFGSNLVIVVAVSES